MGQKRSKIVDEAIQIINGIAKVIKGIHQNTVLRSHQATCCFREQRKNVQVERFAGFC